MPNIIEISSFEVPELDVFARLTEGQLRSRMEPEKGVFIAESPKVIERALNAGYEPVSLLMERKHIGGQARDILARCGDVPVYTADREMLAALTLPSPISRQQSTLHLASRHRRNTVSSFRPKNRGTR